jgi:hypothetical protein
MPALVLGIGSCRDFFKFRDNDSSLALCSHKCLVEGVPEAVRFGGSALANKEGFMPCHMRFHQIAVGLGTSIVTRRSGLAWV